VGVGYWVLGVGTENALLPDEAAANSANFVNFANSANSKQDILTVGYTHETMNNGTYIADAESAFKDRAPCSKPALNPTVIVGTRAIFREELYVNNEIGSTLIGW